MQRMPENGKRTFPRDPLWIGKVLFCYHVFGSALSQYTSSAPTGGSLARLSAMASSVGIVSVISPLLYFS